MYPLVKHIHLASVVLTFVLFFVRGLWMLSDSPQLQKTWVKIAPHIVDPVLLTSAIGLAVMIKQYPFQHGWVTAKVIALVAYVIVGTIGLKRGKTKAIRALAWFTALLIFAYIVSVALTHNPLPFRG